MENDKYLYYMIKSSAAFSSEYSPNSEDILSACKLGLWAFRNNGQTFFGNGVAEILGLADPTPTFENFISSIHPQDLPDFLDSTVGRTVNHWGVTPLTQACGTFDFRIYHSGSVRFIQGRFRVNLNHNGSVDDVVGTVEDVTEAKLVDRRRFETLGKLAQLGQMVSAIIHEINTPLAVMSFYAQTLERDSEKKQLDQTKVHLQAGHISRLTLRMEKMIKSMKYYMAPRVNRDFELTTLAPVFTEARVLCEEKLREEDVTLFADIPERLPLECRPGQLSQVLTNLILNAVESIRHLPERWIRVEVKEEGQKVKITVTDSGFGIPPEIAQSIMLPFFTTREGHGTGLGLSLCCEIVDQHHGYLRYDDQSPRTTFVLELPLRQPS